MLLWTAFGCSRAAKQNADTGLCTALSYDNFGAAFMVEHCQGCHSSLLSEEDRAGAPLGIYFDTEEDVQTHLSVIRHSVEAVEMPPMGGIPEAERQQAIEWLRCEEGG